MYNFEQLKHITLNILIINGPNLNLLGSREVQTYGTQSFEEYLTGLKKQYPHVLFSFFQSNVEGELINRLHEADREDLKGILLNAGGYSHTSVALADAVAAIRTPVVSIHISNIYQREEERHKELLAKHVKGGIYGLGLKGYELALRYFI